MRLALARSALFALLIFANGCNIGLPDARPTATVEVEPIATIAASPRPTATLTRSPITPPATPQQIELATPPHAEPTAPPTAAASPTPTSLYIEYLVNQGETLFYIIQLPEHGYGYEPNVAATVVALNVNLRNADDLRPGQTILLPRPTLSPTPVDAEATQALLASLGVDNSSGAELQAGSTVGCHNVVANDSMIGIAIEYNTTLEILSDLNRDLNWSGCNFTQPSGGPDCGPALSIAQCIRVPLPTPLPTKIPTPTGAETATPTPTKMAPRLLIPAAGADISGDALALHWVGINGMNPAHVYLVEVIDQTQRREHRDVSSTNIYRLPLALAPADNQPHIMQWRVSVAARDDQGRYYFAGAPGEWRSFTWRPA